VTANIAVDARRRRRVIFAVPQSTIAQPPVAHQQETDRNSTLWSVPRQRNKAPSLLLCRISDAGNDRRFAHHLAGV
jgi:hypothetical protein